MPMEVDQQELRNNVKQLGSYLSSQLQKIQASAGSISDTASAELLTSAILDLIEDQERMIERLSERVSALEQKLK